MSTPAGWYDDGSGRQRWWNGEHWTEHYADTPPTGSAVTTYARTPVLQRLSYDDRRAILSHAVATEVAYGGRVESQTDTMATVVRGHRANHVLHLILTLVTAFLWAIVWLIVVLASGERRIVLTVDDYGHVLRQ